MLKKNPTQWHHSDDYSAGKQELGKVRQGRHEPPDAFNDAPKAFYHAFSADYAVAQELQADFLRQQHELKALWQKQVNEALAIPPPDPLAIERAKYERNPYQPFSDDFNVARPNKLSLYLPDKRTKEPDVDSNKSYCDLSEYQVIAFGPVRQRVVNKKPPCRFLCFGSATQKRPVVYI